MLLLFYGPASTAFSYLLTFLFVSGSLCNIFIITLGFLTGLVGPILSFSLRLIGSYQENPWEKLVHLAKIVEWIGFAIMTWCLPGAIYAAWVALPLFAQSLGAHRWYLENCVTLANQGKQYAIPFH